MKILQLLTVFHLFLCPCESHGGEKILLYSAKNIELGRVVKFGFIKNGFPPEKERWNPSSNTGVKLDDIIARGRQTLRQLGCAEAEKREITAIEVEKITGIEQQVWVAFISFRDKNSPHPSSGPGNFFRVMVPLDKTLLYTE
ncbi:MAG: hypothetical protein RL088_2333 [Verrucomicrobiota bacterium]